MAIFGPKPQINPFGKMSIFRLFELVVFIAQKCFFFVLEYRKRHFPGLYCLRKKSWKNGHSSEQNHGLTPLEKCQFFDLLNLLFLQPRKEFFSFQNIVKDIFLGYIAKKKRLEKWPFSERKPWVNPFGKMSIFRPFELVVFIAQKRRFFLLEYCKRHFPDLHRLKKKSWKNGHFWTKTIDYPLWRNVNFSTF